MSSKIEVCVVGGGFRGIAAAWFLAEQGQQVTLVEAAPQLGGVLAGREWNGCWLDLGCHLFDHDEDSLTEMLLGILGEAWAPVQVRYGSSTGQGIVPGMALASLLLEPEQSRAALERELVDAARLHDESQATNLLQRLELRYGPGIAARLDTACQKLYRVPARELEAEALSQTIFQRVQIAEDARALELKRDARLDARIAASSGSDQLRFQRPEGSQHAFRNFYPAQRGTRGFVECAERALRARGVRILTGTRVSALERSKAQLEVRLEGGGSTQLLPCERLEWTAHSEQLAPLLGRADLGAQLSACIHGVPLVLHYYLVRADEIGPWTYVNDFGLERRLSRASAPGSYLSGAGGSGNCPPGSSYVCVELPVERQSEAFRIPESCAEQLWQELRSMGFVRARSPLARTQLRVPASFRVQRLGWRAASSELERELARDERLHLASGSAFTKSELWSGARRSLAA